MTDREFVYKMVFVGADAKIERTGELIRCKDCRWFLPSEGKSSGWCSFSQHGYPNADDYCSDAERKDNEID